MNRKEMHRRQERRKFNRGMNVHHVIPLSRQRDADFDVTCESNQVTVNRRQHALYHALFSNKTPQEALEFLCKTFWKGQITLGEEI